MRNQLRVVVWNVAQNSDAWAALDRLEADICLLNEAVIPEDRKGVSSPSGTHGRDGSKGRPWTAAVITNLAAIEITDARPHWRQSKRNVPFECSRPGSWAAAKVETPLGGISAIALYGLMDELSDASVHRSLSEISPILDDPSYKNLVVLGGDLNTCTQWADKAWNRRDLNVLDRIEALGLIDCIRLKRPAGRLENCPCRDGDLCTHVRTRRDRQRSGIPYQNDYLFASRELSSRLISCDVMATDEWFSISDHAPIVAAFAIS